MRGFILRLGLPCTMEQAMSARLHKSDSLHKKAVRTRRRISTAGGDERLVADPVDDPADGQRKKRLPNSGCMKKGETRNPNGRPKAARGTKALVKKLLSEKTSVREGGRSRRITRYHALLLKELQMAFDGDWRARRTIIELGRWALLEDNPLAAKPAQPGSNATDEAILAWFEAEVHGSLEQSDAKPE